MYKVNEIKLKAQSSIREALEVIDRGAMKIALVVDDEDRLIGTLTDGDIRRGLLKGLSIEDSIKSIYNPSPSTALSTDSKEHIIDLAITRKIYQIPVLDNDGRVVRLSEIDHLIRQEIHSNQVVLMAGGLGSRLKPLTDNTPKPMLKINGKPILERVILRFKKFGFNRFTISLNYKGDQVKSYFGDGRSLGVEIQYIEETKQLGTSGALSLLSSRPKEPFFVMNGDILTHINFESLLDFHHRNNASATMSIREYDMEVPYGVVRLNKESIVGIDEKPVQKFYVNAGIYVLNPETLDLIPKDERLDMTTLFEKLVEKDQPTLSFPIREFWMDIGTIDDFERANNEYRSYFDEK